MILGVDLDDCIVRTADEIMKELGYSAEILSRIDGYSISDALGIDERVVRDAIDRVLEKDEISYRDDFVDVISRLRDRFYPIHIVTNRHRRFLDSTMRLLMNAPVEFGFKLHFCVKNKHGIPDKSRIIVREGIDVFVEDRTETVLDIYDKTGVRIFLLDRPWNKDVVENSRIKRVRDWWEIEKELSKQFG